MTTQDHDEKLLRDQDPEAGQTQVHAFDTSDRPTIHEPAPVTEEQPDETLQRRRFGGVNWGAGFFGALVLVAMGSLLAALVTGAVLAAGRGEDVLASRSGEQPTTMALVAAAVALGLLVIACYAGGYVAGRMSRFDGGRQGLVTWLFAVLLAGVVLGISLLSGLRAEVQDQLAVPALELSAEASGVVVLAGGAVALVGALVAAVLGGKVGCRYHRKVDDAAFE